MSESGYLFRGPRNTPASRAGRPPEPRTETRPGMVIDRDVAVLTGSGATIWVDVYRPAGGEAAAPIVGWSPYGKHNPAPIGQIYPNSGVRPEWRANGPPESPASDRSPTRAETGMSSVRHGGQDGEVTGYQQRHPRRPP